MTDQIKDGWSKVEALVFDRLDRLSAGQEKIETRIQDLSTEIARNSRSGSRLAVLEDQIQRTEKSIVALQVKMAVFACIGGAIPALVVWLIKSQG